MSDTYPYEDDSASSPSDIHDALGQSDVFLDFQEQLSRAAQVNRPVLIVGERGTGKELAASRLHYLSKRWDGPFVAFNCAAVSMSLIEAELFGHEAGAFTGAGSRRLGRFETAHEGTLFLDEIGNTPIEAQEKILRAVEYGSFERVGSSNPTQVDVRIVGATNVNLRDRAETGLFMPDLLDRLSFEVLVIPPLRDRLDDIALLANHFAARMAMELEWGEMPEITPDALDVMVEYEWPGNVRELKNVIERAVYRSNDFLITQDELILDPFEAFSNFPKARPTRAPEREATNDSETPADSPIHIPEPKTKKPFSEAVQEFELALLRDALDVTKYNQRKAADELGLTYHQFRGLYRKYQDDVAE